MCCYQTHSKQKADESKVDKSLVKQKPDGGFLEESSKPKADKSEAENGSVNEESSKPKADENSQYVLIRTSSTPCEN